MKKIILIYILFVFNNAFSQKGYTNRLTEDFPSSNVLKYQIYSAEYNEGKQRIIEFMQKNKLSITNQNETKNSHYFEFTINDKMVQSLDSFCNTLGYISSKNLYSYNNEIKLAETRLELERLETKKEDYEKMQNKIDSVGSNRYYQHWEKTREIDSEIFSTKKKITQLESVKNLYTVSIDLNDEQSSPSNSKVNFVHMPGLEYVSLFTENPKTGVSYASYQGVFLKYLFTKGKSYFSLGALKANPSLKRDSLAFSEIFVFTFGQDWYSRHLGRGTNKFLNLYIGYQTGYSIAYNNNKSVGLPFACPETGIELFKNKYLLIDVNVNYFLPISNLNRDMRAWRAGTSINFTF